TPADIVFAKTLSFFCAVQETGCSFDASDLHCDYGGDSNSNDASSDESVHSSTFCGCPRKVHKGRLCSGKMIIKYGRHGQPHLQCEHCLHIDKAHLILRNLQEFNIQYLTALVTRNQQGIKFFEEHAYFKGHGPLVSCSFQASPSEQKDQCHKGTLQTHIGCDVKFAIYTPYDLFACPRVIIMSRGIHSHNPPPPIKTPPPIEKIFSAMLIALDWKLADTTPRKLMTDSGFIANLQQKSNWTSFVDPPLSALHPSLGNFDHVRRLINNLRKERYPNGTGFTGAMQLVNVHASLPEDNVYICCAETHIIKGGKVFHLVICTSKFTASALLCARYVSIDTAFKCVYGKWQEFEMETWDENRMISIVGAHAYTTSQSARAHCILFTRIFDFTKKITGLPVLFRHIHGTGIHIWVADAHRGQALGI
ncbi:hypothetical protein BDQ17DRAFT_1247946, partial [Cyathus striatus]